MIAQVLGLRSDQFTSPAGDEWGQGGPWSWLGSGSVVFFFFLTHWERF